jgi:hypothetical protein
MDNYLYLFHYLSSQYEKPLFPIDSTRAEIETDVVLGLGVGGRTLKRIDINSQDHRCSILPRVRAEEIDFFLLFDQLYNLGPWK